MIEYITEKLKEMEALVRKPNIRLIIAPVEIIERMGKKHSTNEKNLKFQN